MRRAGGRRRHRRLGSRESPSRHVDARPAVRPMRAAVDGLVEPLAVAAGTEERASTLVEAGDRVVERPGSFSSHDADDDGEVGQRCGRCWPRLLSSRSAEVLREVAQLGDGRVEDVGVVAERRGDGEQVVEDRRGSRASRRVERAGDRVEVLDQAPDGLVARRRGPGPAWPGRRAPGRPSASLPSSAPTIGVEEGVDLRRGRWPARSGPSRLNSSPRSTTELGSW